MTASKIKMLACVNMGQELGEFNPYNLHQVPSTDRSGLCRHGTRE